MRKWKDAAAIATFFAVLALLVGWFVFYMVGPCDKLDWIPTSQAPSRCLPGGRG